MKNELQLLRESKGLTQTQASDLLEVPIKSLQNWEQGRYYPGKLAMKGIRDIYSEVETKPLDT